MSIKFKSFIDKEATQYRTNTIGDSYKYPTTNYATAQVEEFIKKNKIKSINIKDIKYTVDHNGCDHILLVYEIYERD